MKPRTREHLLRAEENRLIAQQVISDPASSPGLVRWACVMAFYAAVQYVNAYLVEQMDTLPGTHEERENAMRLFKTALRPILPRYLTLKSKSSAARYDSVSQFTAADVRSLIDNELESVRLAVVNELNP